MCSKITSEIVFGCILFSSWLFIFEEFAPIRDNIPELNCICCIIACLCLETDRCLVTYFLSKFWNSMLYSCTQEWIVCFPKTNILFCTNCVNSMVFIESFLKSVHFLFYFQSNTEESYRLKLWYSIILHEMFDFGKWTNTVNVHIIMRQCRSYWNSR